MIEIPVIVRLNTRKHHFSSLRSEIFQWSEMEWENVREELKQLGNNQFDVYTGKLSVEAICKETLLLLSGGKIKTRDDLRKWLGTKGYRILLLSDHSRWIVRECELPGFLVHVHPGRNQLLAGRIKASHLKTAIALIHELKNEVFSYFKLTTEQINAARKEKLGLSPVKSAVDSCKIKETLLFVLTGQQNRSNENFIIFQDESINF